MSALRPATPDDVSPLGKLLGNAFAEDPFARWMLGPERTSPTSLESKTVDVGVLNARRLELLYSKLVSLNLVHRHVFTNVARSAVAIWRPPDRWKMGAGEELSMFGALLRTIGGARFVRLLPQFLAIQRRHPKGPYAQLVALGVDPAEQGRGLGSRLLRPTLEDCDARGTATYLETSKERNLSLYERYGFRVTDVFSIPNGPNVWFMWRDPVAS